MNAARLRRPERRRGLDILDAIIGAKIIVGMIQASFFQRVLSDLNGNGEIEILDLIQLLQFIVGEIDQLQCRDFQALPAP